jgi:hypothetical protein
VAWRGSRRVDAGRNPQHLHSVHPEALRHRIAESEFLVMHADHEDGVASRDRCGGRSGGCYPRHS